MTKKKNEKRKRKSFDVRREGSEMTYISGQCRNSRAKYKVPTTEHIPTVSKWHRKQRSISQRSVYAATTLRDEFRGVVTPVLYPIGYSYRRLWYSCVRRFVSARTINGTIARSVRNCVKLFLEDDVNVNDTSTIARFSSTIDF